MKKFIVLLIMSFCVVVFFLGHFAFGPSGWSRGEVVRYQIEVLEEHIENYRKLTGEYPSDLDGVFFSTIESLDHRSLEDPWGFEIRYKLNQENEMRTFELISYGADGIIGGTGDASDIHLKNHK